MILHVKVHTHKHALTHTYKGNNVNITTRFRLVILKQRLYNPNKVGIAICQGGKHTVIWVVSR